MSNAARTCPVCQTAMVHKRRPAHAVLGALLVLICGVLALPTLGVSLIFMLWGIFLIKARLKCPSCGHQPKRQRR